MAWNKVTEGIYQDENGNIAIWDASQGRYITASSGNASPMATAMTSPGLTGSIENLTNKVMDKILGPAGAISGSDLLGSSGVANIGNVLSPAQLGTLEQSAANWANLSGGGIASGSPFSLGGIGATGNVMLPALGAAGFYDLFKNKRKGARGALQGAASGAAMGSFFPGAGTLIGGGLGLGAGLLGGLFAKKRKGDAEQKKWKSLIDKGLIAKESVQPSSLEYQGSKGVDFDTAWKAAKTPEDKAKLLWGYAGLTEKLGPDYMRAGEQGRMDIAKLFTGGESAGDFRERYGTVDFNWTPEKETKARQILMAALKRPEKERQRRIFT